VAVRITAVPAVADSTAALAVEAGLMEVAVVVDTAALEAVTTN
jgi:hypothetical protein